MTSSSKKAAGRTDYETFKKSRSSEDARRETYARIEERIEEVREALGA